MKSGSPGEKSSEKSPRAKGRHLGTVPVRHDRVIELREEKGWSPGMLAKKAAISPATVKSVEEGNEAFPDTIERIAAALGTDYLDVVFASKSREAVVVKDVLKRDNVYITYYNMFLISCDETTDVVEQARAISY